MRGPKVGLTLGASFVLWIVIAALGLHGVLSLGQSRDASSGEYPHVVCGILEGYSRIQIPELAFSNATLNGIVAHVEHLGVSAASVHYFDRPVRGSDGPPFGIKSERLFSVECRRDIPVGEGIDLLCRTVGMRWGFRTNGTLVLRRLDDCRLDPTVFLVDWPSYVRGRGTGSESAVQPESDTEETE